MDCVSGQLLFYRLKGKPEIEKITLFEWMGELLVQLEQYQRCRNNRGYRYVNPYSVLVTREDRLLLLDLEAESNAFVMKNLQKQAMRSHFVKPIVHIKENIKMSLDLYGYGKTVQFIMANTEITPALSGREAHRIERMIEKCLGEHTQKQYEDLRQVLKEIPVMKEREEGVRKKRVVILTAISLGALGILLVAMSVKNENLQRERSELQAQIQKVQTQREEQKAEQEAAEMNSGGGTSDEVLSRNSVDELDGGSGEIRNRDSVGEPDGISDEAQSRNPEDGLDGISKETDALERYVEQNTNKTDLEVIWRGEELERKLLRYLAVVYEREGRNEKADAAYGRLCAVETDVELLEAAYLKRMALGLAQGEKENAQGIAKEAAEKVPGILETKEYQKLKETYELE